MKKENLEDKTITEKKFKYFNDLIEICRNKDGNYYFIYSVPKVRNTINTKAKPRDELLIVGINQKHLIEYLNSQIKEL